MAERPDPDTDRRNILPGEHAKPDGTWCPYLAPSNEAGVWVCMKCGNSGGVSTPATDPNTLADDIDQWAEADEANARNYSMVTTASTLHERAADLRAAAVGLRQLADENRALREAILDAATELGLTHEPDWASDKAKADGKDPVWCRICGPADGSWPCTSQMVVTDLLAAADRGVREGQSARDSALAVFDACTPDQLLTLSQMALDMARIKSAAADRGVTDGEAT